MSHNRGSPPLTLRVLGVTPNVNPRFSHTIFLCLKWLRHSFNFQIWLSSGLLTHKVGTFKPWHGCKGSYTLYYLPFHLQRSRSHAWLNIYVQDHIFMNIQLKWTWNMVDLSQWRLLAHKVSIFGTKTLEIGP